MVAVQVTEVSDKNGVEVWERNLGMQSEWATMKLCDWKSDLKWY